MKMRRSGPSIYWSSTPGLVYAAEGKAIAAHAADAGDELQRFEGHQGPVTCILVAAQEEGPGP